MKGKEVVSPEGLSTPFGVWSHAISVVPARLLFVSGLTARDENGDVVGVGDVAAQTRRILENLKRTVEAAGGTMGDVASVTVFVRDVDDFAGIHAVRREFFPEDPPASTMVEVSSLVDERCLIEINAIAALGDGPSGDGTAREANRSS